VVGIEMCIYEKDERCDIEALVIGEKDQAMLGRGQKPRRDRDFVEIKNGRGNGVERSSYKSNSIGWIGIKVETVDRDWIAEADVRDEK
jgi:hypothetical protein